jgi:hypothetical protein
MAVRGCGIAGYQQAMAYVTSCDRSWPYSFENLRDTIGVDAGYLRRGTERVKDSSA